MVLENGLTLSGKLDPSLLCVPTCNNRARRRHECVCWWVGQREKKVWESEMKIRISPAGFDCWSFVKAAPSAEIAGRLLNAFWQSLKMPRHSKSYFKWKFLLVSQKMVLLIVATLYFSHFQPGYIVIRTECMFSIEWYCHQMLCHFLNQHEI